MINTINRKNIFFRNFIFLALGQGVNQLIPLLITPFLLSKIGATLFGQYAIYQYVILYVSLFVNFGFLLSGTKNIAITSLEEEASVIFSSIFYSKFFNFIGVICLFLVGIYFYPPISHYYLSYAIGIIITGIGYIFYQDWLFQGKQNFFYQFICIIISKIIYLIFIFIGAKWFNISLPYLIFIDSVSILIMGIISHFIVYYLMDIKLKYLPSQQIKKVWIEGAKAFTAGILTSLFTSINVIILGFFSSSEEISVYTIADRTFILLSGFFAIISRVIFPNLSLLINSSESHFNSTFNKNTKLVSIGVLGVSFIIFFFGKFFLEYLLKQKMPIQPVFFTIKILLVALVFQTISSLYSYYFILKLQYKIMNFLLAIVAFFNIILAFIIIPKFGAIGAATATATSFSLYYLFSFLIVHGFIKFNTTLK